MDKSNGIRQSGVSWLRRNCKGKDGQAQKGHRRSVLSRGGTERARTRELGRNLGIKSPNHSRHIKSPMVSLEFELAFVRSTSGCGSGDELVFSRATRILVNGCFFKATSILFCRFANETSLEWSLIQLYLSVFAPITGCVLCIFKTLCHLPEICHRF